MADIRYQRLTFARQRNLFGVVSTSRSSLWLGPDHLLCVDYNGFAESYKRFYFRDIQAITVRETRRRTIWNSVLTAPLVICLTGLMAHAFPPGEHIGGIIGWSIPTLIFFVPFVFNNILGTACATQLRTAVQTEELPSLRRVRKTRKVLDRIRPLIAAAQGGEISTDDVSSRLRDAVISTAQSAPQTVVADAPDAPPKMVP
jgi:hypothetical protein